MNGWIAGATTFLASGVECVEAATIVLAVGYTAGWRVALRGTLWALLALVAIVAIFGPALLRYVPLNDLKVVIGVFLVLFGFTWLRKAIWRYAGRKAVHDENAIFDEEVRILQERHSERVAFATAFNGVMLEGLEVAVIVLTFAAARPGSMAWSAAGALLAAILVTASAFALRHPLSRVPENAMGFAVGIMLLSFGTLWTAEGMGVQWPLGDTSLALIIASYVVASFVLVAVRRVPRAA